MGDEKKRTSKTSSGDTTDRTHVPASTASFSAMYGCGPARSRLALGRSRGFLRMHRLTKFVRCSGRFTFAGIGTSSLVICIIKPSGPPSVSSYGYLPSAHSSTTTPKDHTSAAKS